MLTDEFIEYIGVQKRYSAKTLQLYRNSVGRYYQYIYGKDDGKPGVENEFIDVLTSRQIRNFIAYCIDEEHLQARSVNLHLSALSGYCRFLMIKGLLRENPVKLIPRLREERKLPHFFAKDALEKYCSGEFPQDYSGMRDRLIVFLAYATGMRRQEIVDLKLGMVDLGRNVLKIRGKGDKEREIPIISVLHEKILVYLQERKQKFTFDKNDPFFLTDKGAPLYLSFVNKVVKRELAGLDEFMGKTSPHVLRHSFATHLLNGGTELNSIKEVLGHSSLAATQVYTHNSFEQLKKIYLTAHPRAKKGG